MKALFISNDPSLVRRDSATFARMQEYAKALGELHIVTPVSGKSVRIEEGSLSIHGFGGPRILSLVRMLLHVRGYIRRHGVDVVSAQDPFEYGLIALLATRHTPSALHIQVHTDFLSPWFLKTKGFRAPRVALSPALQKLRVAIAGYVLKRADGIRTVSKRVRSSLEARYHIHIPISVIPIATSSAAVGAVPLPPHTCTFSLITVSRLEPEKRIEDILYALARIQQLYPSVGLFIIGDGSDRAHLEKLTKKLGLTSKVYFLGARSDARGLMKSAHAYIQASAYEGYGLTLVEAALARIPIITTDVGIVGEVLRGYEEVLSAPVADPAQLAVHITGLVEDHQARISLALNAEHTVRAHIQENQHQPQRIKEDLEEACKRAATRLYE